MLKVYGWTGHRAEPGTTHGQSREIVAARSMAEAKRIVGKRVVAAETRDETEVAMALTKRDLDSEQRGWNEAR